MYDIISGCLNRDDEADRFLLYAPKEQAKNALDMLQYILTRTRRIFKWSGLPETIPERSLELMLQTHGCVCWTEIKEGVQIPGLYVFFGNRGGEPDIYYMPTKFIIANPRIKNSNYVNLTIGENCVVMPNDSMYKGLLPLLSKYCFLLAENELTISVVDTLARSSLIFSADDEQQKENIDNFIDDIKEGELSSILSDKIMGMENMGVQPGATASASILTNLIEVEQYWKASMYNELGLNANWNAKRESLSSSESLLNSDTLRPLIDDMLKCRQDFCEEVNKKYNTNISVELDSAWEDNQIELDLIQEQQETINQKETETKEKVEGEDNGQKTTEE